jgi:CopG family transcriptional regulator, nickel-responsive regulator
MGVLCRIGVAIDSDLLRRFDRSIGLRGYTNRSEAFRDLIRDRLSAEQVAIPGTNVAGTVTIFYDHLSSQIPEKLTELLYSHRKLVVSTGRALLDRGCCLEVFIVQGRSAQVEQLADCLIGLKGVQNGRLVLHDLQMQMQNLAST